MRNDKILAYKMRMQGKSYTEISEGLGMSKSTLSTWFRHLIIPKEAQEKILHRSKSASINALLRLNRIKIQKAEASANAHRIQSKKATGKLGPRDVFLLGISLYWMGGFKSPIVKQGRARTYHPVSFTSADPEKIKLFLKFLREHCKIADEKILADLRAGKDQNSAQIIEFWKKTTELSFSNFRKVYITSKTYPYGTIQIRVNSTPLFHKIMGWIEGLQNS